MVILCGQRNRVAPCRLQALVGTTISSRRLPCTQGLAGPTMGLTMGLRSFLYRHVNLVSVSASSSVRQLPRLMLLQSWPGVKAAAAAPG